MTDTGTPGNIHFGRAYATYNAVELGLLTNIKVNREATILSATSPKYGKAPLKSINGGSTATITCTLQEFTNANLALGIPNATVANGILSVGGSTNGVITPLPLIVTPLDTGEGADTFHLCTCKLTSEAEYNNDQEGNETRTMDLEFTAHWDPTQAAGEELYTKAAGGDVTAPTITSVKILGTSTDLDAATDVAVTIDFTIKFGEVVVAPGGRWNDVLKLYNFTDKTLVSTLTVTTSKISPTNFDVYVDPGALTLNKSYALVILTGITDLAGNHLAAASSYDFDTVDA